MPFDWTLLFSPKGRISRKTFWLTFLGSVVAYLLIGGSVAVLGESFWAVFPGLLAILVVVVSIQTSTKRLHDIGRSGWWQLLPIVPYVIVGVLVLGAPGEVASLVQGVLNLVIFAGWAWVASLPGDPETNRFGPSPLAASTVEAAA